MHYLKKMEQRIQVGVALLVREKKTTLFDRKGLVLKNKKLCLDLIFL